MISTSGRPVAVDAHPKHPIALGAAHAAALEAARADMTVRDRSDMAAADEDQADRPDGATQMCALVTNPDHSVVAGSGTCVDLPEQQVSRAILHLDRGLPCLR